MIFDKHDLEESLAPFSRRSFLKGSVSVGVGITAALTLGCSSDAPSKYQYINNADAQVLSKLVSVMFPDNRDLFPVTDVPVMDSVNHLLSFVPPDLRKDLSTGITLFNYGAVILGLNLATFTSLNQDDAVTYVNDWQKGNEIQRGLMTGLKKLIYTAYWRDERTWAPMEFDGPVSDKWGLKSLGNTPMPAV